MQNPSVIVFLKAPVPGQVKTRLARNIGPEPAMQAYKTMAEGQLERIGDVFPLEVHFAPRDAEPRMKEWLGEQHALYPQCGGDLGERLQEAIASAHERNQAPIICIGGDCPSLNSEHLNEAADALAQGTDLVIGPSEDGGYYLIGLRKPFPQLLAGIPWSSSETLEATIARAKTLGLSIHLLEALYDVDELPELERAQREGLL